MQLTMSESAASEAAANPTAAVEPIDPAKPLISLNWTDATLSVSIVGTSAPVPKSYEVMPELDPTLPSRKELRPIKLAKTLKRLSSHTTTPSGLNARKVMAQQQSLLRSPQSKAAAPSNGLAGQGISQGMRAVGGEAKSKATVSEGRGPLKSCHICGRGFNKATYLKRHILSHSSVKPYKCEICGWGFFQFCNLKRHMASHTINGGQGFKCLHCTATFSTKSVLSVHMRDSHGGVKAGSPPPGASPPHASTSSSTSGARKSLPAGISSSSSSSKQPSISKQRFSLAVPVHPTPAALVNGHSPAMVAASQAALAGPELPKLFSCTVCKEKFDRVSNLNKHQKTHGNANGSNGASA